MCSQWHLWKLFYVYEEVKLLRLLLTVFQHGDDTDQLIIWIPNFCS